MSPRTVRPRRRRLLTPGINLTPLLDVIFNLVFFFLLATTLRREEVYTKVSLPSSELQASASGPTTSISLDRDGRIFFQNREYGEDELLQTLIDLGREGLTEITLRGDEEVNFGRFHRLIELCKRAGLEAVNVAAEKVVGGQGSL